VGGGGEYPVTKALVEANKRLRNHFSAARNEDGMEAAQVILILVLVVLVVIPVISLIANNLKNRATEVNQSISGLK